jgi:hypothetical protein
MKGRGLCRRLRSSFKQAPDENAEPGPRSPADRDRKSMFGPECCILVPVVIPKVSICAPICKLLSFRGSLRKNAPIIPGT